MRTSLFIFITNTWLALSYVCYGQSGSELQRYMANVRTSNTSPNQDAVMSLPATSVLKEIPVYYRDSLPRVRSAAYAVTAVLGLKSRESVTREMAVSTLILGVNDKDAGNVGQLWNLFSKFNRADFNQVAKDSLKNAFRKKPLHVHQLVKLIGFLELNELKEEIRSLTLPAHSKQDRWAALLALARMGDTPAIESIMQRSQKLKINDDVVYDVLPDLLYTRHQEAINYLIKILESDEKNCHAADAENETLIPCAYRVMEMLAPVLEGYPIQVDASGDMRAKNYEKALNDVRKWVKKHQTNLRIKKDSM